MTYHTIVTHITCQVTYLSNAQTFVPNPTEPCGILNSCSQYSQIPTGSYSTS